MYCQGQAPKTMSEKLTPTQRKKIDVLAKKEFHYTGYPETITSHVALRHLKLTPLGEGFTRIYLDGTDEECAFCNKAIGPDGQEELIQCYGKQNGMVTKKDTPCKVGLQACRTMFHVSCLMKRNADDFLPGYAALPDNQAALLCALHCCAGCNQSNMRQSAYVQEDIVECIKCYRAFHKSCLPAGAENVMVTEKGKDGKERNFEAIICPSHAPSYKVKDEDRIPTGKNKCYKKSCKNNSQRMASCNSCYRSYHTNCSEVKKVDGNPSPNDTCDFCLKKDFIMNDTPVVVFYKDKFMSATTLQWQQVQGPGTDPNFEKVGYVAVRFALQSLEAVVHVKTLMELHAVNPTILEGEQELLMEWDSHIAGYEKSKTDRCPKVLKAVYKECEGLLPFEDCTHLVPDKVNLDVFELCRCKTGEDKCTSPKKCPNVNAELECPPECDGGRRDCSNRSASRGDTNNICKVFETTDGRGRGVKAVRDCEPGTFLGNYFGELISRETKEKRVEVVAQSRDKQAMHYLMELNSQRFIDAARNGNYTRYINHSCNPNADTFKVAVCVPDKKGGKSIQTRILFRALRSIKAEEEITISYNFDRDTEKDAACLCKSYNCDGHMTRKIGRPDWDKVFAAKRLARKKNSGEPLAKRIATLASSSSNAQSSSSQTNAVSLKPTNCTSPAPKRKPAQSSRVSKPQVKPISNALKLSGIFPPRSLVHQSFFIPSLFGSIFPRSTCAQLGHDSAAGQQGPSINSFLQDQMQNVLSQLPNSLPMFQMPIDFGITSSHSQHSVRTNLPSDQNDLEKPQAASDPKTAQEIVECMDTIPSETVLNSLTNEDQAGTPSTLHLPDQSDLSPDVPSPPIDTSDPPSTQASPDDMDTSSPGCIPTSGVTGNQDNNLSILSGNEELDGLSPRTQSSPEIPQFLPSTPTGFVRSDTPATDSSITPHVAAFSSPTFTSFSPSPPLQFNHSLSAEFDVQTVPVPLPADTTMPNSGDIDTTGDLEIDHQLDIEQIVYTSVVIPPSDETAQNMIPSIWNMPTSMGEIKSPCREYMESCRTEKDLSSFSLRMIEACAAASKDWNPRNTHYFKARVFMAMGSCFEGTNPAWQEFVKSKQTEAELSYFCNEMLQAAFPKEKKDEIDHLHSIMSNTWRLKDFQDLASSFGATNIQNQ